MEELHRYLRSTGSTLSVDLFDFDYWVRAFADFVVEKCFINIKVNYLKICVNILKFIYKYPITIRKKNMYIDILFVITKCVELRSYYNMNNIVLLRLKGSQLWRGKCADTVRERPGSHAARHDKIYDTSRANGRC